MACQMELDNQLELIDLIKRKQWSDLIKELNIRKSSTASSEINCTNCRFKHSLLHTVCKYEPLLSIVKKICILTDDDSCMRQTDCYWRTPFQIAIAYNANYNLIEYLSKKNISAASSTDVDGNTPMHTLLLNYQENLSEKETSNDMILYDVYVLKVVKLLCSISPSSLSHRNNNDLRPIEIAIDTSVKPDVLVLMWNTDKSPMTESVQNVVGLYVNNKKKQTQQRKLSFTGGTVVNDIMAKVVKRRGSLWF